MSGEYSAACIYHHQFSLSVHQSNQNKLLLQLPLHRERMASLCVFCNKSAKHHFLIYDFSAARTAIRAIPGVGCFNLFHKLFIPLYRRS